MIRKNLRFLTMVMAGFLVLVSCDYTKVSVNLQNQCNDLSNKTARVHRAISGSVYEAGMGVQSTAMCDRRLGDCSEFNKVPVYALVSPISGALVKKDNFIVYTKKEPVEGILKKDLYFEVGKKYEFCAVYLRELPKSHKVQHAYKIEDISTISEIK